MSSEARVDEQYAHARVRVTARMPSNDSRCSNHHIHQHPITHGVCATRLTTVQQIGAALIHQRLTRQRERQAAAARGRRYSDIIRASCCAATLLSRGSSDDVRDIVVAPLPPNTPRPTVHHRPERSPGGAHHRSGRPTQNTTVHRLSLRYLPNAPECHRHSFASQPSSCATTPT